MDPLNIARAGLMAASNRFQISAVRTASMDADPSVDPAEEAVEQISAKQQFSANLGVIRVSDQMWRSLMQVQEASDQSA
ncbi:MAG TPA: flagellar basal body rod C-terminal domain-containing protein [Phenylobacterium sp.]|jgi:flagellar basal body rod protein FlgC|nr:flagellar basal body rod C-terminal domain-containing protein [Phenylobacterium sp.]